MSRPQESYPLARITGIALTLSALVHALLFWLLVEPAAPPQTKQSPTQYQIALQSDNRQQATRGDSAESLASSYPAANPEREPAAPPITDNEPQPIQKPAPKPRQTVVKKPEPASKKAPSAADIIASGLALAASGIDQSSQSANKSSITSLSAKSSSPSFAAYLAAWTNKVERVGRLNYPNNAIPAGQEMSLMLDVVMRADGSVADKQILRGSGNRALDKAALEILKQAAPFPPFPPEIAREHPRLRITRRWRFAHQSLGLAGN
ncbi:MAG: TonB family protein [Gammaproteobacteria bacterium]